MSIKFTHIEKRRLTKLADALETLPADHFNMKYIAVNHHTGEFLGIGSTFGDFETMTLAMHDCGTAACVLGFAASIFRLHTRDVDEYLGFDALVHERLFMPHGYPYHSTTTDGKETDERVYGGQALRRKAKDLFTTANAARAVRELRDTGEVPVWWFDNSGWKGAYDAKMVAGVV